MTDKLFSGQTGQNNTIFILFLLFLVLGIFFRVYGLGERDLWTDEAWVALAATQPTPAEVLKEGKSTPPLYLLTVWGMVQVFGRSETALRLTSCLLGIGTLLLFWPMALALLPRGSALTAFGLVSVSDRLVYFSKELKQYSADVFFAVLVFWLMERQLRRQGHGGWLFFTILLALGLGFSHPLVFILPVAALVLWWELPPARKGLYLSFGALGLIFFGYYWFLFRGQLDPELLIYWQADFPNVTCGTDFLCWLGAGWGRFGRYFFSDWGVLLGLVFLAAGLGYFFKSSKPRVVWYFFGPLLAALAAAFAQRYPFMGHAGGVRLMMFSAPMLYLVTGAGIWAIFDWLWGRQSPAAAKSSEVLTPHPDPLSSTGDGIIKGRIFRNWSRIFGILLIMVVVFWLQPVKLWQENLHPRANREEIEPLVNYVRTHLLPGDAIYVYYFAIDPFKFYYPGPRENIIWGQSCHDGCLALSPEDLQRIERLWMIFSHFETPADVDRFIANLLGQGWTRHLKVSQPGAVLFCYLPPWGQTSTGRDSITPPGL
jgi:hypothetical protein